MSHDEQSTMIDLYALDSATVSQLSKGLTNDLKSSSASSAGASASASSSDGAKKEYKQVGGIKKDNEALIPGTDEEISQLEANIAKQGMKVKEMKKRGDAPDLVSAEVEILKKLKKDLDEIMEKKAAEAGNTGFDFDLLSNVIARRMFVVPSFEIHGGVKGLYDFGPPGVALKDNILSVWKNHFILEEQMLQVECTCMTPYPVLEASGHVDRFTDLMVKDEKTGECFRADKLLEDHIQTVLSDKKKTFTPEEKAKLERISRMADSFSEAEIDDLFKELDIRSPTTKNVLSKSFPFNLMFATTIGPEGTNKGFLRPETAQGIFVLFKRLLEYNNGKTPFAGAQIGLGFRNEISPRSGLLRVREFCMAEIEHFVHPNFKDHPKFKDVENVSLLLFPSNRQLGDGLMETRTIGDAVRNKIVANETLGYFMARTHLFLVKIGIDPRRLRFRQHLPTEMAHYASDCWDAEIHMSYGWIECVGHADRACYDLEQHSKKTGHELKATRPLEQPKEETIYQVIPQKAKLGALLKKELAVVLAYLESLEGPNMMKLEAELESKGKITVGPISEKERDDIKGCLQSRGIALDALSSSPFLNNSTSYELNRDVIKFVEKKEMIYEEKFYPAVIEPSFGIGRIVYAVLEHSFKIREGEEDEDEDDGKKAKKDKGLDRLKRSVMAFPPQVAPIKCGVASLLKRPELDQISEQLTRELTTAGMFPSFDPTGSAIGKKYSKCDEVGTPFFITVDPETVEKNTVTVRERDTGAQIRVPLPKVVQHIVELCTGRAVWNDLESKYPRVR